jgi:hypothetical protein
MMPSGDWFVSPSGAHVRKTPSQIVKGIEYDLQLALPRDYDDNEARHRERDRLILLPGPRIHFCPGPGGLSVTFI